MPRGNNNPWPSTRHLSKACSENSDTATSRIQTWLQGREWTPGCAAEHRDSIYFFNLICTNVHSQPLHPLLKASWEGDKRALESWHISNPPRLITKMCSSHWTATVHWNCTSPKTSQTDKIPTSPEQAELQTKGSQNQELLTWLWQISKQGSLKGHFSRRNLSKGTKGQSAPRFLPVPILQDNPSPYPAANFEMRQHLNLQQQTISNQFCR